MQKPEAKMLKLADQCVKCGICLPSCPTNKLTNLEGHSPRGRIALWQSIANQQLAPTEQTLDYLNQCLSCGACENNCPAGVKFLDLQATGKSYLLNNYNVKRSQISILNNLIVRLLSSRYLNKLAALGLYLYQRLNLTFIPYLNSLAKVAFPANSYRTKTIDESDVTSKQNVLLFTGCVNTIMAQNTIKAIIAVLNKLGVNTIVEHSLTCCGALYSHSGEANIANNIIQKNQKTLANLLKKQRIEHVLTIDTGCHQQIAQQFLPLNQNNKHDFVLNIQAYLLKLLKTNQDYLSATANKHPQDIYIYNPCSQREQLKTPDITQELLKISLPNSRIKTISEGFGCCGAAGRYMLDHPQTAEKLAMEVLKDLVEIVETVETSALPENAVICTSNIGCAIHLQHILLKNYGIKAVIKHPIMLICENLA